MKKNIYHIICSWALLICFVTGQYMVYAHQHYINKGTYTLNKCHSQKSSAHTIVSEKCALCDSMHHVGMDITNTAAYHNVLVSTTFVYKTFQYEFTSIALILSPGRAPPIAS